MSEIQPIPAIHYMPNDASSDISNRLAPPYDVLDAAGRKALLERDTRNFVQIDLPHVPAKEAGPPAVYEAAANQFRAWLADGTLVRDSRPALFAYHQHFRHDGVEYVRKMFFARLRLEEFGRGSVFPHEQTFGGPKEDRLRLTQATRCNLSPIFGVYEDERNVVAGRIERELRPNPLLRGTLDGVENRLWSITDPRAIDDVRALMNEKAIFIADGHHRYGTSLNYRSWLAEQQGALPEGHPANYVLCVFCAMEDAGLLIMPTHRVLPGVAVTSTALSSDTRLDVSPLAATQADAAVRELAGLGPQAVGLFAATEGRYFATRPRQADLLRAYEAAHSDAWRALGVAFLHAYLLDRRVTPDFCGGKAAEIRYVKAAGPAVDEARQTGGSVFLLQPTTMAELRAVCRAGDLMPQKSTYFYPKLATGLIVNPLSDD
jgi:uncharacterized protein (DUF1015 family)